MSESARFGKWEVVKRLNRGGQGQVYLVRDVSGTLDAGDRWKRLQKALTTLSGAGEQWRYEQAGSQLAEEIREIIREAELPQGALKELLPFEEGAAEDEAAAFQRMKRELSVLESVSHPSLVKVLDSNLDDKWFVMEYLEGGRLSDRLETYRGRFLDGIRALRPIVDAVRVLHMEGVVHRDIKPDNIFLQSDGHLVLGDCGLAFKVKNEDRLTLTWENVGTREFQPAWSYGKRLGEVRPTYDVFSLAKVLWAMLSGRPRFPLWYFDSEDDDLRRMFPTEGGVHYVHEILGKCVVEREEEATLRDAGELLEEVDVVIAALSHGCQLPGRDRQIGCRFCGVGTYREASSHKITASAPTEYVRNHLVCDKCGHVELFVWSADSRPALWD
ncbi:MAG: protein kinase [Proteobacteria bacterium]|nr:protein kinase [Pseudomonadota bacterium]